MSTRSKVVALAGDANTKGSSRTARNKSPPTWSWSHVYDATTPRCCGGASTMDPSD